MQTFWIVAPTIRDQRQFGLVVGSVFALLGGIGIARGGGERYAALLAVGLLLIALGVVLPRSLRLPYQLWMAMAFVIGAVMTGIVLTLTFFIAFTIIGFAIRIAGRDPLQLRWPSRATSHWTKREAPRPDTYSQPY